jgi:sialate O-acetylesterase
MIALSLLFVLPGGELALPAQFSDHMVLQRETQAPLWGTAAPNASVELVASWPDARPVKATADAEGRWRALLATPPAGGPHEVRITSGGTTRVLADVLVGEVWLASGQSNMEWTLGPRVGNGVEGWQEAVRDSADPALRFFEAKNTVAHVPHADVFGEWRGAGPETAGGFSAVAYFFARELRRELGVPVGVLSAEWGGTPAEAWVRAGALAEFPEFAPELARMAALAGDRKAQTERWQAETRRYWEHADQLDGGRGLGEAAREGLDDSGWAEASLPTTFERHGLETFDGLVWYRRRLELPAAWAARALVLELGAIDDRDTVFWNGTRIGGHENDNEWQTPRRYVVPKELVRAGANLVAVRVLDTGGLGGFASPAAELRLAPEDGRGTEPATLPLAGPWRWRAGTPMSELGWPPALEEFGPNSPSTLWNGMIAPLVPSALAGVIWYQGESNRGRADQYLRLMTALITDWRTAFARPELPFLFVQIAPFGYDGDTGETGALRDAQRRTLALPRTGMAVTMDVGDPKDIHPLKKREVGERLARLALTRAYGRTLEDSGPLFRAAKPEGARLRLTFEHAAGLTSRGASVAHVSVAGADHVFHPAEARIEGEALVVWSAAVPAPLAARFGWGAADQTNLWNTAGLPAACFRSDDWAEGAK